MPRQVVTWNFGHKKGRAFTGKFPPVKGYGGLPCRFDLVCATCDCERSADTKQMYEEYPSTCKDLKSGRFAAVQTFSTDLEGFELP